MHQNSALVPNLIPLILEPEALAGMLDREDLLVIDLSRPETYAQVHLPGAVYVAPSSLIAGTRPAPGKLPSTEQLEDVLSHAGYAPDKHIVAYDDEGGGWAGRFLWTLDLIGHQNMSYLNGGIHAWLDAGLPVSQETQPVMPTEVQVELHPEYRATLEEVLASLPDEDTLIWDARTPEEHAGTKVVAARGGRIPGAINVEWTDLMDRERQLRIREDAREYLAARGIEAGKKIITHCQTHHRSGFTYLVGKSLGFDIRAYDGSWSEWGNHPDTPVETS